MTMNEGARIYSPGGELLPAGGTLEQPGLVRALELLADEGPEGAYRGALGEALLALMDERGGLVTRDDLLAYRALWSEPLEIPYAGTRFFTRGDLSGLPETLRRLPTLAGLPPVERVLSLVEVLDGGPAGDGHTTTLTAVDAEGSAEFRLEDRVRLRSLRDRCPEVVAIAVFGRDQTGYRVFQHVAEG